MWTGHWARGKLTQPSRSFFGQPCIYILIHIALWLWHRTHSPALRVVGSEVKIICRNFIRHEHIGLSSRGHRLPPSFQQTCRLPSGSRLQNVYVLWLVTRELQQKERWSAESNANKNNNNTANVIQRWEHSDRCRWGQVSGNLPENHDSTTTFDSSEHVKR